MEKELFYTNSTAIFEFATVKSMVEREFKQQYEAE
jgi:hypothetical protein